MITFNSRKLPIFFAHLFTSKLLSGLRILYVNSNMLRHQMKALTFMIQREQAWSYEDSQDNLWVRDVDDTGDLMFVTQKFGKGPS
jgi:hypothetical protein